MKAAVLLLVLTLAIGSNGAKDFMRSKRASQPIYDFEMIWTRLKNIERNLMNKQMEYLKRGCKTSYPFVDNPHIQVDPTVTIPTGTGSLFGDVHFKAVDPTIPPLPTETVDLRRTKRRSEPHFPPSFCKSEPGPRGIAGMPGLSGMKGSPGTTGLPGISEYEVQEIIREHVLTRCAQN